jgi:hypothetical protein
MSELGPASGADNVTPSQTQPLRRATGRKRLALAATVALVGTTLLVGGASAGGAFAALASSTPWGSKPPNCRRS